MIKRSPVFVEVCLFTLSLRLNKTKLEENIFMDYGELAKKTKVVTCAVLSTVWNFVIKMILNILLILIAVFNIFNVFKETTIVSLKLLSIAVALSCIGAVFTSRKYRYVLCGVAFLLCVVAIAVY